MNTKIRESLLQRDSHRRRRELDNRIAGLRIRCDCVRISNERNQKCSFTIAQSRICASGEACNDQQRPLRGCIDKNRIDRVRTRSDALGVQHCNGRPTTDRFPRIFSHLAIVHHRAVTIE